MARPKAPLPPPPPAAWPGESLSLGSLEYLLEPVVEGLPEAAEEAIPEAGPTRCEVEVGLPRLTESM